MPYIRRESQMGISGQGSGNGAPALPVPGGQAAPNPAGGTMNFNPIPNNIIDEIR